jgi:hypothetical protein
MRQGVQREACGQTPAREPVGGRQRGTRWADTEKAVCFSYPPFDNHLEGSSIKRYSEVAEAMTTLQYHPSEETGEATLRGD